jgi:hypothetical protein
LRTSEQLRARKEAEVIAQQLLSTNFFAATAYSSEQQDDSSDEDLGMSVEGALNGLAIMLLYACPSCTNSSEASSLHQPWFQVHVLQVKLLF